MNIINLWNTTGNKDTDNLNIVKSWLCGSTSGQTYSITDNLLEFDCEAIEEKGYEYEFPESAFDEIVGFEHDMKVDDADLEEKARKITEELRKLNGDVNEHPELFFNRIKRSEYRCGGHHGISCDYCVGLLNECIYGESCPFKEQLKKDDGNDVKTV